MPCWPVRGRASSTYSPACRPVAPIWATPSATGRTTWSGPNDNWLAEALLSTSAESVLSGSPDARVVQVDGFPAVQTDAPGTDPARACLLHVDVAPGQSLLVRYLEGTGDNPAMNHALACHKAQQAAEFMVNQLRTLGS